MTREQKKRAKRKEERTHDLQLAKKNGEGRMSKAANRDDIAAVLEVPYSMFHTNPIVDTLVLPFVEVHGAISVRVYNVGQSVPVVTKIPSWQVDGGN